MNGLTIILIPVAVFGVISLVMGAVLAVASKLFAIEVDEREEKIAELLPGANCGGCGFAGCSACAAAIAKGDAPCDACPGLSADALKQICEIMGQEAKEKVPMVAAVMCSGSIDKVNYRYFFDGSKTCRDIAALQGGDKLCSYACLGYGDCVKVCNFNAISTENGIAEVNRDKCTACGMCVKECPREVISIIPKDKNVVVKCNSKNKGAEMKAICSVGCIGCKMCEKVCEAGAITVVDNLAKIDTAKCTGCGACAQKCPKKIIHIEEIK